jgi:GAF domain-containing protein
MTFPVAVNEAERLKTLRDLNILDTAGDTTFDRITTVARDVFSAPIAAISFIDEHRQWFKSHPGLDVCQTGREEAFCNYTILQNEVFEVTDAALHPDFKANPLVIGDPHIRYYAGAAIRVRSFRVGTLCVIAYQPRTGMSDTEIRVLENLADLAAHEIDVRSALKSAAGQLMAGLYPTHLRA